MSFSDPVYNMSFPDFIKREGVKNRHLEGVKSRILVDRDFVIWSLGGYPYVAKLSEQLGFNIYLLLGYEESPYSPWTEGYLDSNGKMQFTRETGIELCYHNYMGGYDNNGFRTVPYPDLCVILVRSDNSRYESFCSDIGYGQTRAQAKKKIKDWFEDKVIPMILEYVFT